MPGMMDSILDLGLSDAAAEGLARTTGSAHFAYDSYRRLIQMYGEVVDGIPAERFEAALSALKEARGVDERHRPDRRRSAGARRHVQAHLRRRTRT